MHRLMGHNWSSRRITTTCIHPENTFSARAFDVETDEDLKDELATALGITRDLLLTYHNPHNGLRFFYVDAAVAALGDGGGDGDAQGYLTDLVTTTQRRGDDARDYVTDRTFGAGSQNYLAQGLLRKGDKNRDSPAVHGICYVCKQCTDRDPLASCFPEDFDVITGRSRVANATHVLALAEMANEEEEKLQKKKAKLESPPPPIEVFALRDVSSPLAATNTSKPAQNVSSAVDSPKEEPPLEEPPKEELPKEEEAVIVTEEKEPACPAGAGHAEEDTLPPNIAALRDQVYCQILLNGIKGTTTPPTIEVFVAPEGQRNVSGVEQVSTPQPPAAQNTSIVAEKEEEAAETVPEQKETKKKPRQRRHHDVCADNIVPEGVRRSARLRK